MEEFSCLVLLTKNKEISYYFMKQELAFEAYERFKNKDKSRG